MLYVTAFDAQGRPVTKDLFLNALAALGDRHELLCFIPAEASQLRLSAIGVAVGVVRAEPPVFHPMGRGPASLRLLLRTPPQALMALLRNSPLRPGLFLHSLRKFLGAESQDFYAPPQDYATWIAVFDSWVRDDFAALPDRPSIAVLVFAREPSSEALSATLGSLEAQWGKVPFAVFDEADGASLAESIAALDADYIGILQAGEVLPPHASLAAAEQIAQLGQREAGLAGDVADLDVVPGLLGGEAHQGLDGGLPGRQLRRTALRPRIGSLGRTGPGGPRRDALGRDARVGSALLIGARLGGARGLAGPLGGGFAVGHESVARSDRSCRLM